MVLPEKNARDLDEVPEEVRRQLEIHFESDMSEVLAAALEKDTLDLLLRYADRPPGVLQHPSRVHKSLYARRPEHRPIRREYR